MNWLGKWNEDESPSGCDSPQPPLYNPECHPDGFHRKFSPDSSSALHSACVDTGKVVLFDVDG